MINKAQKSPKKITWNSVFPTQFVKNTLIPDLSFIICIVSEKSKFINHLVCITLVLLLALLCSIHGANFFFKASPRGSAGTFREWKNDQYAASRTIFYRMKQTWVCTFWRANDCTWPRVVCTLKSKVWVFYEGSSNCEIWKHISISYIFWLITSPKTWFSKY